jgi:hypothetical protein
MRAAVLLLAAAVDGVHVGMRAPPSVMSALHRRSVLATAASAAVALSTPNLAFAAGPDYAACKKAIEALIAEDENLGPTMIRLAWHSRCGGRPSLPRQRPFPLAESARGVRLRSFCNARGCP